MRYRTGSPAPTDKELFSKLVVVSWEYEPKDASGLPGSEAMESMEEFEEQILDKSDEDRWWGSGVAVITRSSVREWRFYTPDVEAFQREFSQALHGLGPYPLHLQVFDDPDWNGFSEIRDSIR